MLNFNFRKGIFLNNIRFYKNKCNHLCDINNQNDLKYSFIKLKQIMEEVDVSVIDGRYKLKEIPNSNFFGEVLLYFSPNSFLKSNLLSNIEFSALGTISIITLLNYFSILFPSKYIFNSLLITNLFALSKFIWRNSYLGNIVYKITLISLDTVKITYFNGKSETIPINRINLTSKMSESLQLWDENKKSLQTQIIPLEIRINGKKNGLIMLSNNPSHIFYSDLKVLMAVLNKNTHNLII
jgi:hypothetical protein